jgi:hypothetical protein
MHLLYIKTSTFLKQSTEQASALGATEKLLLSGGTELPIVACLAVEGHLKITLGKNSEDKQLFFHGKNTWFVYAAHVEVVESEPRQPEAKPVISFNPAFKNSNLGKAFNVPGISATLYANTPIGKSKSFFWYEATHGLTRLPQTSQETAAIIRIAEAAQVCRDKIGKPFHITSWYRPEPQNSRVGGARDSRHLYGDAIDFYIEGMTTHQMYQAFHGWWDGGLGKYAGLNICHLDARGHTARWYAQ